MGDYDVLFEPVRIGPKTAPNRFYQVPHCNGLGHARPTSLAAMRGIKAEGGWGVVCTEEVEIHPTSDLAPYVEGRLWDDDDIAGLRLMTEAVHEHGSLAGIELTHAGLDSANHYSRMTPIGPRSEGVLGGGGFEPVQTRAMTRRDFADVRRWHRAAALRARDAGFDIVYCYAAHGLTLPMQLLSRRHNDRTDEYGGSLENRVRFLREIIEDTKDAVGHDCAVAVRLAVDELVGSEGITHDGEAAEIVAMLAELPDLWDVNVSGWSNDSATSRFSAEGHQEPYIAFVKGAHHQARGRRRPLHLARLDGVGGDARCARPHRRRAPVDRRSAPAAQDPRGSARRDPRVHRLQHLRGHRPEVAADPLHPEPDDGRGVAALVAPRADPRAAQRLAR